MSDHASPSHPARPTPPAAPSTFPPDPPSAPDAPDAPDRDGATGAGSGSGSGADAVAVRLHTRVALPLILLVALLARIVAALRTSIMMNDAPDFLWQAQRFLDGDFASALAHPYHPLYGGVTALFSWLIPGPALESVALWVALGAGLLVVPAAFFAVRQLLPDRPELATGAALIAGIHGRFVATSAGIQSEGLFTGLIALACWALVRGVRRDGSFRSMLGAGLLVGLAFLVRPEGLYLLAIVVPWLFGIPVGRGRGWIGGTLGLGLGALLIVVPYSLAVRQATGAWGVTAKPALAAIGLTEINRETVQVPDDAPLGWPVLNRIRTGDKPDPKDDKGFWIFWDNTPPATTPPAPNPGGGVIDVGNAVDVSPVSPVDDDGDISDIGGDDPSGPDDPAPPAAAPLVAAAEAGAEAETAAETAADTVPGPRKTWDQVHPARKTLDMGARTLRWDGLALVLVGAFVLFRRRTAWALSLLLLVAGFVGLLMLHVRANGYLANRHFILPLVLLLPFFGAGVARLLSLGSGPRAFVPRLLAVLCVLALLDSGIHHRRTDERILLSTMTWVTTHTEPGERIAVDRRRDAWVARRPGLVLAFPSHDAELFEKLDRYDIRLLVVAADDLAEHKPHWTAPDGPFVEVARFGPDSQPATTLDRFPDLRDEPDLLVLERRR